MRVGRVAHERLGRGFSEFGVEGVLDVLEDPVLVAYAEFFVFFLVETDQEFYGRSGRV